MMKEIERREFLVAGGTVAVAGILGRTGATLAANAGAGDSVEVQIPRRPVYLRGDGISLNSAEYSARLSEVAGQPDFEPDLYANGGVIGTLEQKFANLLGKETAVFLPTGTLANHVALRRLAGDRSRVIVQAESHIYNDSGDCAQSLSGLNLVPVSGAYTPETILEIIDHTANGRVKTGVGAISLESPVRRAFNTGHTLDQAKAIADLAHRQGMGAHLDGARLFMLAAHHGFDPADYAAPFDTVYVSLYKNFNAAGGAILAGTRDVLADLLHERRMFGGSSCRAWPQAAVALLYCDDFISEYQNGKKRLEALIERLTGDSRFRFEPVPGGSNGIWLHLTNVDPGTFVQNLSQRDIHLIPPRTQWRGLLLMINPTIQNIRTDELVRAFRQAAQS